MRDLRILSHVLMLVVLVSLLLLGAPAWAAHPATDTTTWFPLVLPWDDGSATPIDASDLLRDAPGDDLAGVIDARGRVVVGPDGHFRFSNTGQRARFWGTNLTFSAAFPPAPDYPPGSGEFPDAQAAEKLAGRLAKLGFNAVRFHHIDWFSRPSGLWLDYGQNTQVMDPVQLGRLDYLIYQLKRHGIYVDLNLHVSRNFTLGDGVTDAPEFQASGVSFNKGATLYDPLMRGLQEQYAAQLLNHVNPYTGLAYKDDPVIFTTETTNEDSFALSWAFDQLNHRPGDSSSFPAFSSLELDGWTQAAGAGPQLNRLRNPGFEGGLADWWTWTTGAAAANFALDSSAYEGSQALRVQVTAVDSTDWHVQFGQANLALQAGRTYRVRFAARANAATTVYASVMRNGDPWDSLGWSQTIALGTSWQVYTYTFTATETLYGGAQLAFSLGQAMRTLWFDSFLLQEVDAFPGWLGWLEDRYGTTAALQAAWAPSGSPPATEMLTNGSFESGIPPWNPATFAPAAATFTTDTATFTDGARSLRAQVTAVDGTDWHVQISQGGLNIVAGQVYRLTFDAKVSSGGGFGVSVMQNHDPWDGLGLWGWADATTTWQPFEYIFTATAGDTDGRVGFDLGQSVRTVWIDNVSLQPFSASGLLPGESLEGNNVARIRRVEAVSYTPQRLRDTLRFYDETQRAFFSGMRNYLQGTLGTAALNTGTASYINSLADIYAMAQLDFVDNHSYWDHPYWPYDPPWSPTGWYINNRPWVNSPFANLFELAATAVQGKPFTVTEFNESFPNRYQAEAPILLALFANLQDWDAVFQFDYVGDQTLYNAQHSTGFFDLAGNPIMTGLMPVASRLFLGYQTAAAPAEGIVSYTEAERYDSALYGWAGSVAQYLQEAKGVEPAVVFGSRLRIGDFNAPAPVTPSLPTPVGPVYVSAGGQLRWDVSDPGRGLVTFDAAQAQGAVGFLAGRTVTLSNLSLTVPSNTAQFSAVVAQSRDGQPLSSAGQVILGIFTRTENTGQTWNAEQTTLTNWGAAPSLVEPLQATVTLTVADPTAVQVWALDETGAQKTQLGTTIVGGSQLQFTVNTGVDKTLWYALLRPLPAPTVTATAEGSNVRLSWPAVPGAAAYRVYRDTENPYFIPGAAWQTTTATTVLDTGALGQPGSMTFYVVQAFNSFAQSGYSARTGEFEFGLVK